VVQVGFSQETFSSPSLCTFQISVDPYFLSRAIPPIALSTMESSTKTGGFAKPIVLHIGDPIQWNTEFYNEFSKEFTVIRPSVEERQRDEFMKALKEKRWGDFSAILRPFWSTGGEMGRWDRKMVPLIPPSCRIFASAGAGFDWADVDILAARG
jgi:hypothetical protein